MLLVCVHIVIELLGRLPVRESGQRILPSAEADATVEWGQAGLEAADVVGDGPDSRGRRGGRAGQRPLGGGQEVAGMEEVLRSEVRAHQIGIFFHFFGVLSRRLSSTIGSLNLVYN